MTALQWFGLLLVPLQIWTIWLNVHISRRYRRREAQARTAVDLSGRITAQVLGRCAVYLDCDTCGARLDPHVGITVALDGDELHLHCGGCS